MTACDHCQHAAHNGLCLVLVDPPEISQARCACIGKPDTGSLPKARNANADRLAEKFRAFAAGGTHPDWLT